MSLLDMVIYQVIGSEKDSMTSCLSHFLFDCLSVDCLISSHQHLGKIRVCAAQLLQGQAKIRPGPLLPLGALEHETLCCFVC